MESSHGAVPQRGGLGYVSARSSTGEAEDCLSTETYPEPRSEGRVSEAIFHGAACVDCLHFDVHYDSMTQFQKG